MTKFYMLVGLPGSGKSTYSNKLKEENVAVYSSDAIRLELFGDDEDQSHNVEVFAELHRRVVNSLASNIDTCYDATNISSKNRKTFLASIGKIPCEKIAIVFATPYSECLSRNQLRDRHVPDYVIERMYKNFTMPCIQEGFSEVIRVYPNDISPYSFFSVNEFLDKLSNIAHDNPHHKSSIGKHMINAHDILMTEHSDYLNSLNTYYHQVLEYATLLHDIGKYTTKTFTDSKGNPSEIAHYYSHNNTGAYDIMFAQIPAYIINDVSLLIQFHMNYYISWKQSEKSERRDRKFLGKQLSELLDVLHDCDLKAH